MSVLKAVYVHRWQQVLGYLMVLLALMLGDWSPVLLFVLVQLGHEYFEQRCRYRQQGASADGRTG